MINFRNTLNHHTDNAFVKKCLAKLCIFALDDDIIDVRRQIKITSWFIDLLERFENFTKNRNELLRIKNQIHERYNELSEPNSSFFHVGAALNSIIMHYDRNEKIGAEFKKCMPIVIEALCEKKAELEAKLKEQADSKQQSVVGEAMDYGNK